MTDLLTRPLLRVPTPVRRPGRSGVLAGGLLAVAVAASGLLICLGVAAAGWFSADLGSFGQAVDVGTLGWLVVNGSGLHGAGFTLGLVPLGLWLLPALALVKAGRWVAVNARNDSWLDTLRTVVAMAVGYTVVGVGVALVTGVDGVQASPSRTAVAFAVTSLLAGGVGVVSAGPHRHGLVLRLPVELRAAARGGATAVLVMVLAGAVLFTGSFVVHVSTALRLSEGLDAGVVGGLIIAVVCVGLVPNAVLCAAAFAAGPGFSVGTGTHVAPSGTHLGLLPDLPVLAALPHATGAWWMSGLIAVPVLAGVAAGFVAIRRHPVFGVDAAALRGGMAGLTGGVAFGLLTAAATGSGGPGRLAQMGPAVLATTVVCAIACLLGGAVGAAAVRLVQARRGFDPDPSARARSRPLDDERTRRIRIRSSGPR